MGILDTLVKEADEEASLPADFVRANAVAAGAVSYFYVRETSAGGEEGLLQPEVQYVYDLPLPEDVIPKPNDDEVEAFTLMPLYEVTFSSISSYGRYKIIWRRARSNRIVRLYYSISLCDMGF
jgi:8-oxo-dGTP pyrophosphatase MutT (NUDIX family)